MQGRRQSQSHCNRTRTDFWISISLCSLPLSTEEMANTALSNIAIVTGLLLGFVLLSVNNPIPPAKAGEKAFDGSKRRAFHQIQSISWKWPVFGQPKYCQSLHGASLVSSSLPAKTPESLKGHIERHARGGNTEPTCVLVCRSLASWRGCQRVGLKGKACHYLRWRGKRSRNGPVLLATYLGASMPTVCGPYLYPDPDALCS